MKTWEEHIIRLKSSLQSMEATDAAGKSLSADAALALWKDAVLQIRQKGNTIFLIGNGASAAMADHAAADLSNRPEIRAETFTALASITALANDFGYDEVFARPLRRKMKPGDMLVAISSSGNSPNILKAVRECAALGGMAVTLSAMSGDNALRRLGNINFYAPADTYGDAETSHAALLHYWTDLLLP